MMARRKRAKKRSLHGACCFPAPHFERVYNTASAASQPQATIAYVTGHNRELVARAIQRGPNHFAIADAGTTILKAERFSNLYKQDDRLCMNKFLTRS